MSLCLRRRGMEVMMTHILISMISRGGNENDFSAKRAKSTGEKNGDTGTSNSQPDINTKSVCTLGCKGDNVDAGDIKSKTVLESKNTPSSVVEGVDKSGLHTPITSQQYTQAGMLNKAYAPVSPRVGEVLAQRTSITPGVHGARAPEHAQLGQQGVAASSAKHAIVSPRSTVATERAIAAVPRDTVHVGDDLAATQHAVHGFDTNMHMYGASPGKDTSIKQDKGNADTPSAPVILMKETPRTYTKEQIVAFGGIQEEARRDVRSSGRLRSQRMPI
ncbi:uncharacterized protein [Lolium perenne]|uniref:uncharacterized protein n=1 Tax=Lolium perenne TaxID=4522 RepID=UPI0021F5D0B9|nr:uncharacterized protein LOC127311561 [Lolium perenne]